jgi:hypothetical protein
MAKRRNSRTKTELALVVTEAAPVAETADPVVTVAEIATPAGAPTVEAAASDPPEAVADNMATVEPAAGDIAAVEPATAESAPPLLEVVAESKAPFPEPDPKPAEAGPNLTAWLSNRFLARAASIAVAAAFGAAAGSLIPLAVDHASPQAQAGSATPAVAAAATASVEKLAAELAALKSAARAAEATSAAGIDNLASELAALKSAAGAAQRDGEIRLSEVVEQLNRAEKAQGDLAVRIAEIKGRLGPPDKAAVSPETTGSIQPAAGQAIAEGWVLRRVYNGRALVQGSLGYYDVVPGADLPGLGQVREITQRDGGWVVVTDNGIIVPARSRRLG